MKGLLPELWKNYIFINQREVFFNKIKIVSFHFWEALNGDKIEDGVIIEKSNFEFTNDSRNRKGLLITFLKTTSSAFSGFKGPDGV